MRKLFRLGLAVAGVAVILHSVGAKPPSSRVLKVVDVDPVGQSRVYNLLPDAGEQPRMAVTDKFAYRLIDYDRAHGTLNFAMRSFAQAKTVGVSIKLPKGVAAPEEGKTPRMAADGGADCVISYGETILFVNVTTKKVKAVTDPAPPESEKLKSIPKRERYRITRTHIVHGGAAGKYALSIHGELDKRKNWSTSGSYATLFGVRGKPLVLKWEQGTWGTTPSRRDAVFAVLAEEVIVLVSKRREGTTTQSHDLTCLVFDRKDGKLKETQTSPQPWAGGTAHSYMLSPNGKHFVAQPLDSMQRFIVERGTWKRIYKTSYHEPCIGFAPKGEIGVFIETHESDSTKRAALVALRLDDGKAVWRTSVAHHEIEGDAENEPFSCVGPGGRVVANRFGIIAGKSADRPVYLYRGDSESIEPLCLAYDYAGKRVAIVTQGRMYVLDVKSGKELFSIPFEARLPEKAIGEFAAFDKKGKRVLVCMRGQGVWLFDLEQLKITKSLPALNGTWARPLPDLSGVVYSRSKTEGGSVILQPLHGSATKVIYRCEGGGQGVCLWISDKADRFLVAERRTGGAGALPAAPGGLFLIDEEGKKKVTYNVKGENALYVGDKAITAFVTKAKQAVLINDCGSWGGAGLTCTVVNAGAGAVIEKNFSASFYDLRAMRAVKVDGRSLYGATAATPYYGVRHVGNEKSCRFACPAGVLAVDLHKKSFTLYAWSRSPKGLTAVNPKGKGFFVAGKRGLANYKVR